MHPMIHTLLLSLAAVLGLLFLVWCISIPLRDVSIIDPFWGAGFVLVGWIAWSMNSSDSLRVPILTGLTTIWGSRLALFLLWRNWGHGEDRRYQAMRAHQGNRFWWLSLFTVFWLQGIILWFVALPIQIAATSGRSATFNWIDVTGITLWCIGQFFEAFGDWQLARFKADPANEGRVMDRGLWRYTRHPNYFGDFCIWWGLYLIAASNGAAWTIGSPLLMSLLLMKISGVTLLESTITDRRPEYAEYQARTNAFFPGPPKSM
jgi:steroid 5-alpha reductase family enzyme